MEQNPEENKKKRKNRAKAVENKKPIFQRCVNLELYFRMAPGPEESLGRYVNTHKEAVIEDRNELTELLKRAQKGDTKAEDKLVRSNMLLVKSLVKSFKGENLEYTDLFSVGNIGLLRAIRAYDTNSSVRFSTFATTCIIHSILDYIDSVQDKQVKSDDEQISIPEPDEDPNYIEGEDNGECESEGEGEDGGEEDTGEEDKGNGISVIRQSKERHFSNSEKMEFVIMALSRLGNDDDDVECENGEKDDDDPELKAELELLRDQVTKAVDRLGDIYRDIVRLRFGLDGGGERTIVDVARAVGRTPNWTATLLQRALDRLAQSTTLRQFIDN